MMVSLHSCTTAIGADREELLPLADHGLLSPHTQSVVGGPAHEHYLGAYYKCGLPGSAPNSPNQNLFHSVLWLHIGDWEALTWSPQFQSSPLLLFTSMTWPGDTWHSCSWSSSLLGLVHSKKKYYLNPPPWLPPWNCRREESSFNPPSPRRPSGQSYQTHILFSSVPTKSPSILSIPHRRTSSPHCSAHPLISPSFLALLTLYAS